MADNDVQPAHASPSSQVSVDGQAQAQDMASPSSMRGTSNDDEHFMFRQRAETMGQLLLRGTDDDAQQALQKLDRLQRGIESKRRWRRHSSTSHAPRPRFLRRKSSAESSKQSLRSEKDADVDSITSRRRFGEVKVAVGSMPGLTNVINRARRNRVQGMLGMEEDATEDGNNDAVKSPSIYGIIANTSRSVSPSVQREADGSSIATSARKNDGPELLRADSLRVKENTPQLVGGTQISPATSGLGQLKEEDPAEDDGSSQPAAPARDGLKVRDLAQETKAAALARPVAQRPRPRLMIQSPTETSDEMGFVQSPQTYEPPPSVLSSTAEPMTRLGVLQADVSNPASSSSRERTPSPAALVSTPGSDSNVQGVIDACHRNMSRGTLDEDIFSPGATSHSSDSSGEGDDSDISDLSSDEEEQISSLNLQHSNELSPKEKKKMLKRIRRDKNRFIRRNSKAPLEQQGDPSLPSDAMHSVSQRHRRAGSLSTRVATGLQYASSQSRNRRAMEKYSPHPSRPSSAKPNARAMSSISKLRSETSSPVSTLGRESAMQSLTSAQLLVQSLGEEGSAQPVANNSDAGIGNDSMNEEERWSHSDMSKNNLQRWGTNASTSSALSTTSKHHKLRRRLYKLRRGRNGPSDVQEEDKDSDHTPAAEEDADAQLDDALGKLAAEQAPDDDQTKYEYDVLYENQRGMLFFGIPKFSARTLFQWDPAPWSDARNGDSVYNIANAQLPNPSWEWVHPEWMIDMSGDVDEAGWQYSFNFGRLSLPIFVRQQQIMPRANAQGNEVMNERFAKAMRRSQKIEEKESERADEGVEALKRSAVARNAKWTSTPTQNSYVRRRRWIRLRMRKPLYQPPPKSRTHTPRIEEGRAFGDLEKRRESASPGRSKDVVQSESPGAADGRHGDPDGDEDLTLSDFEEGSSSSSADEVEGDPQAISAFFPRKTPGRLQNGDSPTDFREAKIRRRQRRHAREFTGTIRELKSLLPSIMDRKFQRSHRSRPGVDQSADNALWLTEIDARNPFLSWAYIKRRLDDDDLAFATSSLRARERRHARNSASKNGPVERSESAIWSPNDVSTLRGGTNMHSSWDSFDLTKDALVEINFRRVLRVLKACKVDRQKLQLWRLWLGIDGMGSNVEPGRRGDMMDLGLALRDELQRPPSRSARSKEEQARQIIHRWKQNYSAADPMDVWDILERRLDRLLMTFEFQSSRASLLRLLLTVHATSHSAHVYRPISMRLGSDKIGPALPGDLSLSAPRSPPKEADDAVPNGVDIIVAGEEWRRARLPRLEFWSDLMATARALLDGAPLQASPQVQRPGSTSPFDTRSISPLSSRVLPRFSEKSNDAFASFRGKERNLFAAQPPSRSSTPKLGNGAFANAPVPRRFSTAAARDGSISPTLHRDDLQGRRDSSSLAAPPAFLQRDGAPHDNSLIHSQGIYESPTSRPWQNSSLQSRLYDMEHSHSQQSASSPRQSSDADRAFLAELLQLPASRQHDLLMRTSATVLPSTFSARSKEREAEHALDLDKTLQSMKENNKSRFSNPWLANDALSSQPLLPQVQMTENPKVDPAWSVVDEEADKDANASLIDRLTRAAEEQS